MFAFGNGLTDSIKWRTFSIVATLSGTDDYALLWREVSAIAIQNDSPMEIKPADK